MIRVPYIPVLLLYGAVSMAHLLPSLLPQGIRARTRWIAGTGVAIHLFALIEEALLGSFTPGLPEALSAVSLGVMVAYLGVATGKQRALGLLLGPLSMVALGTALVVPHRQVVGLDQAGTTAWLPIHLGLLFAGIGGFALSAAVGAMYLFVQRSLKAKRFDRIRRLPSLETLDRTQFRAMLFGFVALTLGIGAGGMLAAASFQESWVLDPKVLYTISIWFWYAVALQVRVVWGRRGRWTARFSLIGFAGMMFSLVGINFLLAGFHAYGA